LQYDDDNSQNKSLRTAARHFNLLIEESIEILLKLFPYRFVDAVADGFSFDGALNNASIFELLQVLGDRRLGKSQFLNQVIADTGFPVDNILQYGDPRRMAQDFEGGGQLVLFVRKNLCFGNSHS